MLMVKLLGLMLGLLLRLMVNETVGRHPQKLSVFPQPGSGCFCGDLSPSHTPMALSGCLDNIVGLSLSKTRIHGPGVANQLG